jgi:hypothetical protein
MKSKFLGAVLVGLSCLIAVPAMADEAHKGGGASFPMPAAAFQQHVTARQAKAREHMEKKAATLSADQAKELRAKFDANIAKQNAEVAKAVADGTVTKEEAQAVRAASGHGGGHHCDKDKSNGA